MSTQPIPAAGVVGTPTPAPPISPLPIMVEIIGEPAAGKTHLASLSARPFLIDTTPKGESRSVFLKNAKDAMRYIHIGNWTELVTAVKLAGDRTDVKTVIIDTSSDLQDMAVKEYLKRNPGRKGVMQYEYGRVRDMIDAEIVFKIAALTPNGFGKNLIMTSQMKDLWKSSMDADGAVHSAKEGRQRDGYQRLDFESDIRLFVFLKDEVVNVGTPNQKTMSKRYVQVAKNRFIDKASDKWIANINPTWEDIKGLVVLNPGEVIPE